jgi:transposase
MTQTYVSSDFIVDSIEDFWETYKDRFPKVKKLLLNLDNGGENSSRRTQFMKRIVEFVEREKIEIELAYYPPYHSKYNPVERVWVYWKNIGMELCLIVSLKLLALQRV